MLSRNRPAWGLLFILLLGSYEMHCMAHRVQEVNFVRDALVQRTGSAAGPVSSSKEVAVYKKIASMDQESLNICKGQTLFGLKYCLFTCPATWVKLLYNSLTCPMAVNSYIKATTAGEAPSWSKGLRLLQTVDPAMGKSYTRVMQKVTVRMVEIMDNNGWFRAFLTIFLSWNLVLFRAITGIGASATCLYKWALDDMVTKGYKTKHDLWFKFFFAGCGNAPVTDEVAEQSNPDSGAVEQMISMLGFAISDEGGLLSKEDEANQAALWEGVPEPVPECVLKLGRKGKWEVRELSVVRGILVYRPTKACVAEYSRGWLADKLSNAYALVKNGLGLEKRLALNFAEDVKLYSDTTMDQMCGAGNTCKSDYEGIDKLDCLEVPTEFRRFVFCKPKDEPNTMQDWYRAVRISIDKLGSAGKFAGAASKVTRLMALGTKVPKAGEMEEASAMSGVVDTDGPLKPQNLKPLEVVSESLAQISLSLGPWAHLHRNISRALALFEVGEGHEEAVALLNHAMKHATEHEEVHAYLCGMGAPEPVSSILQSQALVAEPGTAAAAGGTSGGFSIALFIIVLVICGGGLLCLGLAFVVASRLEEKAEVFLLGHNSTATEARPLAPHRGAVETRSGSSEVSS